MFARKLRGVVAGVSIFLAAISIGLAQVRPPSPVVHGGQRTVPRPLITALPLPGATPAPGATSTPASHFGAPLKGSGREYPAGTRVPLADLPRLPMKALIPTIKAKSYRQRHPFAQTGVTINIVSSTCANLVGDLFPTGCNLTFKAASLAAGKYQDYEIAPNATTATAVGASYTNTDSNRTIALTNAGVYTLGVYDVNNNDWVAVVYVNAGNPVLLKVYQDPYFSEETYQFDASSSGDAYVHMTNLSANDLYVVDIESTSVHPTCVFSAPAQTSMPANTLCNPGNSAGETAPGGVLSVAWPITSALGAGTYSITLYDKSVSPAPGQRIAQVQVSLTGSNGITMTLNGNTNGSNTTVNPSPAPAVVPQAATVFAWDDSSEQSVSGVTLGVGSLSGDKYIWSINDPTGYTAGKVGPVTLNGIASQGFTFGTMGIYGPGDYPSRIFTAGIYDSTSQSMYASQSFKVVGYNAETAFHTTSDASSLSVAQGSNATATLKFTNSSDLNYGVGNGDSLAGIAYTTGPDFTPQSGGSGTGVGVMMALAGKTLAQCVIPSGCSTTVTDPTTGYVWSVNDYCSDSTVTTTGECYLVMLPQSNGVSLPVGDTLTIPNVTFYNATGSGCSTQCQGSTSILPSHGVKWSRIDTQEAFFPTYFQNGATTLTGTAHLALVGYQNIGGSNNRFTSPGVPEAHLYQTRTVHATYGYHSPYGLTSQDYIIYGLTVNNGASSQTIKTVAVAQPGPFSGANTLNNVAVDSSSSGNNGWGLVIGGQAPCQNLTAEYFCVYAKGTNPGVKAGNSATIYIDQNVAPFNYGYTDWVVSSVNPNFSITADGTTTVPVNSPSLSIDTLAFAQYALDSSSMSASFAPGTAGQGATSTENIVVSNASTSSDPNPDYVDAILIGVPNGAPLVNGNPTTSSTGWSYLGSYNAGSTIYYWFGVCPSQYTNANTYLPPAATPNTSVQNALPQCTAAQENNSLAPGGTFTGTMVLSNLNSPSVSVQMWAHGANGDGWSAPKTMTLPVSTVTASAGFSNAGKYGSPPAVASNTVPTIGGNSDPLNGNSYVYTVKNTTQATNITSFRVRIPGVDVSGNNAYDGSNAWHVTNAIPTLGGNVDGCTITNAIAAMAATAAGADGEIDVGGASCKLKAGDTITLSFSAIGPEAQSDSYPFDTYCLNNTAGTCTVTNGSNAGENWLGDTRVQVQLTIGLNVVVDPSNPGPGSSTPVISCPGCSFSGTTVDVGTIGSNSTGAFTDIVRASIYIQSNTTVNYTLSVSANQNPANSTGTPTNELLTAVDPSNSTSGAGINFDQTSYAVVPTATTMQVAHGASITTRSLPYDVLQDFQVSIGNESIMPQASVVTYTLIAN